MTRRALFVWGLSVLLLAWIMAMAALSSLNAGCARDGQHFSVTPGLACRLAQRSFCNVIYSGDKRTCPAHSALFKCRIPATGIEAASPVC